MDKMINYRTVGIAVVMFFYIFGNIANSTELKKIMSKPNPSLTPKIKQPLKPGTILNRPLS